MELERTIKHESKINEVFSFQVFSTKTNIYTLSYLTFACPVFIAFGASSGAMNPPAQETPRRPRHFLAGLSCKAGIVGWHWTRRKTSLQNSLFVIIQANSILPSFWILMKLKG